ncbi:hypothetical protein ACIBCN_06475 [Nocardia sp. NPDC051052]|uniref:hypothetical protein n=1 Tax=Nocardia sp. NPDC051052 TaxID=3364322 RepID=UPI0037AE744F
MQGNWNHDKAHYRCRFPAEYALANKIDHPTVVYLREERIIDPIDSWLAQVFRRDQIEHTLATLEQAQPDSSAAVAAMRTSGNHWPTMTASSTATAPRWKPAPTPYRSRPGPGKPKPNAKPLPHSS